MTFPSPPHETSAAATTSPPAAPRDRPPAFTASLHFASQPAAEPSTEEMELLPLYAPSAPAARPKRTPRYSLARTVRQFWRVLPVVAAALVLLATQVGIKYGLTKTELQGTHASLKKTDRRGYTLAMRVAWLEEALELAIGTALTAAPTSTNIADLNRLEWRRSAKLVATAAVLSTRVDELDKDLSKCREIQVLHGGSDERKEEVFGGGGT